MCSLIDDGKNPDEFTRDVLNGCIAKNQITKGKTDAFKVCYIYFFFLLQLLHSMNSEVGVYFSI